MDGTGLGSSEELMLEICRWDESGSRSGARVQVLREERRWSTSATSTILAFCHRRYRRKVRGKRSKVHVRQPNSALLDTIADSRNPSIIRMHFDGKTVQIENVVPALDHRVGILCGNGDGYLGRGNTYVEI
ncbi:hypothetical protein AJ78_04460 [Emergomyces pasteurianus Ep9510]|uniref:Uncharacterized protein n=1 Tax=Emergomyces pasteurianus Ep9510 TaxID=1447872 RepID=A0A1J9Q4Y9_9EURO|nr:hypothetical protein AJ78_04460 [Emergomyces pasteurianus Ep9510]